MQKQLLRQHFHSIRAEAHKAWGEAQQAQLEQNLFSLPFVSSAKTILLYYSVRDEVPTHLLIKKLLEGGRKVALPVSHPLQKTIKPAYLHSFSELEMGLFGVFEPKKSSRIFCSPKDIDVAIVPGLAFDLNGTRLGWGLGYYDRFLPSLSCPIIGLAYDAQISNSPIPSDAHDVPVHYIVSEKRIVACKPSQIA